MSITPERLAHPEGIPSASAVARAFTSARADALDLVLGRRSLGSFLSITRPRVLALVVITAVPILLLEQAPPLGGLGVLLGVALTGAACSVLNAWMERDIDARMKRTRARPLPSGELPSWVAVAYGLLLTLVSTLVLLAVGGPLAATVGLGTIAFYVVVYTGWLKRRTPQNIVIGGAAGGTAPLIADAAVDGAIGLAGALLFLVIFLWTPAHFWAIALYRRREYEAAGLPMMPSVVGDQGTRWRMLAYGLATVATSFGFVQAGLLGPVYAGIALAAGAAFLARLGHLLHARTDQAARATFLASNVYLLALLAAMLLDLGVGAVA